MDEDEFLAARFEEHRGHLKAVAHRMLGSLAEADDAVQEAWLRVARADASGVENMGGWLTTIVARVCLNALRSRAGRREQPLDVHVPDPVRTPAQDIADDGADPEREALLADSVGLALLVVLDTLGPAERLAFVLHDLFSMPFDEIAPVLDRSEAATRQLASRARRRVQAARPSQDADLGARRGVVDAFLTAARGGDLAALVELLAPDVVVRTDGGPLRPATVVRGRRAVAEGAMTFARLAGLTRPAWVDGAPGAVALSGDRLVSVATFTVAGGKITALDIVTDPERLALLDPAVLRP
ncbi:sigma-70 family RNA polymerase sigma factor [Pseudonocardia kunmingensis]|uniref:RNA polymerase sigma-70 factor (ECF subfamily) n=1 Tax=Pseudonocardia kunmingensis TaxID=630975 RepID=A0A543DZH0_9PSEU|nr:sigma-70 family RNA polymerase sigma factor [Pseudonocardia kunmingensis]TQM14684.1 RNA polymerase sigma-70 factor (ECF subfamily) [Pseudonocardia kunmingensis]